jgi:predicted DCC family thiol-disulfide oxidoreductase YuxK
MIPIDMARDPTAWILLYDPDCGFCRWSLAWVLRADRDNRVRPVPLGSPESDALLADLTPEERMRSWHLIAPDGRRWSAGYAAPPLLRLLPGGKVPATVLAAAPEITDRAYRFVADHRSTFSKLIPERGKHRADERIAAEGRRTPAAGG